MDYQPGSPPPVVEEGGLDFREIFRILNKWKILIAMGAVLFGVISALWGYYTYVPTYQASALLMVNDASTLMPTSTSSSSPQDLNNVVGSLTKKPVLTLDTYLVQLNSGEVQQMMYKDLGLDKKPFIPGLISANVLENTNLINVSVQNQDPRLAADMANSLCRQFLMLLSEKDNKQMAESVESLKEQSVTTDSELKAAMDTLRDFQQKSRGVTVLEQEIMKKSEIISTLEADLDQSTVELAQITAGTNHLVVEMQATPRNDMKKYTDATGKVVSDWEPNLQYSGLYQQYVQKKTSIVEKQAEVNGYKKLIQKRRSELNSLNSELASKKLTQDQLQRDVDRLTSTADTLATKTTEAEISKSIKNGDSNVTIVSEATVPGYPVGPNINRTIALAILAGLMLFTLIAFLLEMIDNTIKTPEDVALTLGLPTIGVIPLK